MKNRRALSRVMAMFLCVAMLLQLMPMSVLANPTAQVTVQTSSNATYEADSEASVDALAAQMGVFTPSVPEENPDKDNDYTPIETTYMVEHYLEKDDSYVLEETATQILSGVVGELTEAMAKSYDSYIAKEFEQEIIEAEGTTVVEIYYDIVTVVSENAEYKVEHYLETENGYIIDETATETLIGEIGAETAAVAKEFEGYTSTPFEQTVIVEDGSAVVEIYYTKDPVVIEATSNGFPSNMTILQDKESILAPGITERQVKVYDKNGDRVAVYIAEMDVTEDTLKIYANYKDNQNEIWGMQKTTEQAAAFEKNHEGENVIVAINGSYFNTSNGRPTGAFVMEGKDVSSTGDSYPFFARLKDGSYLIGAKGEYSRYKDQIQEAIGGYIHLVEDGKICSGLDQVDKYPRQTIGITEDSRVIIMTADCLSAVDSAGLTIQEQAEVMLSLGCVEALHLDGGGSGTYCSRPAGSDTLVVTNDPSNGSERAVSNTLIVVSTAVADGTFDRAILTAEHNYVMPGSVVKVSATGVDVSGGVAEIPSDALWKLADNSFGTLENGVFTSNNKVGAAEIQLVIDSEVVGSVIVEVVNPDRLDFGGRESITVPYEKSVDLGLVAYYGINEVFYSESAFEVGVDNIAVSVDGLQVTAPSADSGVNTCTLTVSLKDNTSVSATATLIFGQGSVVIFDFENGTPSANLDNWIVRTHESKPDWNEQGEIYIVDAESGRVHNGSQAMAFHTDFSQTTSSGSSTAGYHALSIGWNGDAIPVKGAKSIGFWLYIPEDAMSTEISVNAFYTDKNGAIQRRTTDARDYEGEMIYTPYWSTKMEESGWHYVYADFSKYTDDLFIHDEPGCVDKPYKRNFFIKIYAVTGSDTLGFVDHHGDFTYYIDDVTVDYSDAVEDREAPVFGETVVCGSGVEKAMNYGKTTDISENNLIFTTNVTDYTGKTSYTGINPSTARIYVDGNAVDTSYKSGVISSDSITLADGYHSIRFEIADNNGNVKTILRSVKVNANSNLPTVKMVPKDITQDRLMSGSVYWVDLVSDDIESIESIQTVLDLNSTHQWELDHMVVADGFDVNYSFATKADEAENTVTVTIERNGEESDIDNNVIASLPIRIWDSRIHEYAGHEKKTPEYMWENGNLMRKGVHVKISMGCAIFKDKTKGYFGGDIQVDHEAYTHYYNMDQKYWEEKGSYHVHKAQPMTDRAANCVENGYTDRTYCDICASVVEWGNTIKATGHTFNISDGVLKCACGQTFTGIWTDGKEYIDGVVAVDGWIGDSFFKNGTRLTGIQLVDGFYYDFGEDGICEGKMKFNGLFFDETVAAYRYAKLGEPQGGWVMIDEKWHYFNTETKVAVTGDYYYSSRGITYHFDETGMTEGVWQKTNKGTRYWYGQWYHQATGSRICFVEIDGNTYNFDKDGYLTTGIHALYDDWTANMRGEMRVWEFDENGILIGQITDKGLINNNRGDMYLVEEDGFVHGGNAHLATYNGDIYFVCHSGKLKQNGTQEITTANSNGLLAPGTYEFGVDGKLVPPFTGVKANAEGILYYYENGKIGSGLYNGKLIEIDGAVYWVKWSGKVAVNETKKVTSTNSNNLLDAGVYEFGADGKLVPLFTGVKADAEGILYYYKDGKIGSSLHNGKLIEIDGAVYWVKWSGKVAVNETKKVTSTNSNNLLDAGVYEFGADGKLVPPFTGVKADAKGILYYYENGAVANGVYNGKLVEIDGAIYWVKWSGKVAANESKEVTKSNSNGLLSPGTYEFGADGKLVTPFTGVKADIKGILYYYEDGEVASGVYNGELVEVDGSIYWVKWSGKVATNESKKVTASNSNGLLSPDTYEFGTDGKVIIK